MTHDNVFVSRDVTFHETHFPYYKHSNPTQFPSEIYLPSFTHFDSDDIVINATSAVDNNSTDTVPASDNNHILDHSDSSSIHDLSSHVELPPVSRKSSRVHKPPAYLDSYKCNTALINTHWCNFVQNPFLFFLSVQFKNHGLIRKLLLILCGWKLCQKRFRH